MLCPPPPFPWGLLWLGCASGHTHDWKRGQHLGSLISARFMEG